MLNGIERLTTTDEEGNFSFQDIPAGVYTLTASGIGYSVKSSTVRIEPGKTTRISLELNLQRNELKEVVVRSSRKLHTHTHSATRTAVPLRDLPQTIQVVDRATLNEQQVYRIDEALKNVAGINLSSSYGTYNFRGFNTSAGSFLTNGIKGSVYPEGVFPSLSNVEKVEVMRGPNAILFGENAVGGNINFVTKQPKKATTVNATATIGSFALYRFQGDATGSLNKKGSLYYVASLGLESGGRFTQDFKNRNALLYGAVKWDIDHKTSWLLNATYNHDRATDNFAPDIPFYEGRLFSVPADFFTGASDSRYKGNSFQLQSVLQRTLSANWKANLLLGYSHSKADRIHYDHFDFVDPVTHETPRGKYTSTMEEPVKAINLFVNGNFTTTGIAHKLTGGVDLNFYNGRYPKGFGTMSASNLSVINPDRTPFIPDGFPDWYYSSYEKFTTNTLGVYVQDQVSLGKKLKALVGLRYNYYYFYYLADSVSYRDFETYREDPHSTTAFIPRAGLVYQPLENISVYGDFNTGFVPQYSNTVQAGGPFPPEKTSQFEVGVKGEFFNKRLLSTFALYQINKRNVLKYDPNDPNFVRQVAVGKVQSRGLEAALTGNLHKGWDAIVNYSYNDTRITESNEAEEIGVRFDNTPHHIASIWTTYRFSGKGWEGLKLGLGVRHTSDRYISNRKPGEEVLVLPAYTVWDAMAAYTLKRFTLSVNANNLLNKEYALGSFWYASYFPGAQRSWLVSIGYALK